MFQFFNLGYVKVQKRISEAAGVIFITLTPSHAVILSHFSLTVSLQ